MTVETFRTKAEWRRWAKATRAQLDTPALSWAVRERLELWPAYQQAKHVLTYLAFGTELNLTGLESKHFYATRTQKNGALSVHALKGELERHPYGFDEPSADNREVGLGRLDLILVPGLAFDRSGARLGYGIGLYDRLLNGVPREVPIIGVVPDALIAEALPREAHDVPMTHLLSESGVYVVGSKR